MAESVGFHAQPEEAVIDALTAGVNRIELKLAAQSQFGAETQSSMGGLHGGPRERRVPIYGTIFLRPFERRRERTLWPPAVFMRARNPVARLRLILLG
jgi:hypothetical protein